MKIVQAHYQCGHDDHIEGMAAIPVTVMPWDRSVAPYPAIERCDECLSLGNEWTDEEARAAVAASKEAIE